MGESSRRVDESTSRHNRVDESTSRRSKKSERPSRRYNAIGNKMDISCFHKRTIKKSCLPSSILIPYSFQPDFLVLFNPMNDMRCSILSHVEYILIKINLKVETREKRWHLCIILLHFIKSHFQHC